MRTDIDRYVREKDTVNVLLTEFVSKTNEQLIMLALSVLVFNSNRDHPYFQALALALEIRGGQKRSLKVEYK